jgi:hypothetical protein
MVFFKILKKNTKTEGAAAEKAAVEELKKKTSAAASDSDTGDMSALMRERTCDKCVQYYVKHLYAQGQFRDAPASYKMQTAYNFKARVDAIRNDEDLKNPEQVAAAIKAAYEQTLFEFQEFWKKAVKEERQKILAAAAQPEYAEPEFKRDLEEEFEPEF